jgi:hypothetical protein
LVIRRWSLVVGRWSLAKTLAPEGNQTRARRPAWVKVCKGKLSLAS